VRRREFISLLTSAAALGPASVRAQEGAKVYRVGVIGGHGPAAQMADLPIIKAFVQSMRALGYSEGHNLVLELRSAEGKLVERTAEIGADFIRNGADVIVTLDTTIAKEMMRVTSTVPIVMAVSNDPIGAGISTNLARPTGNITGFTIDAGPEIDAKRLQLLRDSAPHVSRIAYIGSRREWGNTAAQALREGAERAGVTLFLAEHTMTNSADLLALLAKDRPDALFVATETLGWVRRKFIFDFAFEQRIPATYPYRAFVDGGGLMSYGADLLDLYRRTAGYVDKLLKGAKTEELPIQQPAKFELVINLKTAKAIGLEFPPFILAQADEVIE
jgi:putative tryptophan/tyrosine transport system substrate-binding protein